MEKLYITDIRTLPDPKAEPSSMADLPPQRREKCLKFAIAEDRQRSLGAGNIIKQILEDFKCVTPLKTGKNGKIEADGIFFNVSHSGDYVIGVASDTPIGCDIEKMVKAPLKIADRFFYNTERDYIMNHQDRDFAFWQMWTLKESYMKMTGEGFSLALDAFEIRVGDKIEVYRYGNLQPCDMRYFLHDGHMAAVCKMQML